MFDVLNELNKVAPCYIKGGAVRDAIMGRTPRDYDFVFVGDVEQIKEKLSESYTAVWQYSKLNIIGFAKTGEKYEACVVDDIENIGQRCDYTMNALLMDCNGNYRGNPGWVIDAKLKNLKMVSKDNLLSDPIRAIRGIRLRHSHCLAVEDETMDVITSILPKIVIGDNQKQFTISRRRMRKEIKKCSPEAKAELVSLGLIVPERWM